MKMPKCLGIVCLLLASFHSCLQNRQSHDGERDQPEDVISCSKPMGNVETYSPFSEIMLGGNVTLECKSNAECLPINYTLFLKQHKVVWNAIKNKKEERMVFNFTINSINELGEYKCKVQYRFNHTINTKYANGFNFTLKEAPEDKNKLVVFIVAPLLLLLLLTVITVTIPLVICPWCKAKNRKSASASTHYIPASHLSSETCPTYDDVENQRSASTSTHYIPASHFSSETCAIYDDADEEVEYCHVNFGTTERDCSKGIPSGDNTLNYAEIIVR